jgi:aminocarboxymuconate-semialdehyde decarboxylase
VAEPVIDVHGHAIVPAAMALAGPEPAAQAARAAEAALFGPETQAVQEAMIARIGPLLTNVDARLEALDAVGIDQQVVSPSPVHYCPWAEPALAERIARTANEGIVAHCSERPDRLHGLGYAPLQVAERVLEDAVGDLGLHGVEISTFSPGIELSSPQLEGFWARAAELDAIVFIHPWGCTLDERLRGSYMTNLVGQPVEHTVALSHIILSGVLDRHPGLRILAAHGGGYLPFHPARMDHGWRVRADITTPEELPSSYLRRIYFDSVVYEPGLLATLVERVGAERVLMGTDFPFDMGVEDPVALVDAAPGLDDAARSAIKGGTAASLLGVTV